LTVAIIDGDVVAYGSCGARVKDGTRYTIYELDKCEFTKEEDEDYLFESWDKFQKFLTELSEICFADRLLVAVKGNGNFRDDLYPAYKANRHADPSKRNVFVPLLREMAVEAGLAIAAHGMEADDQLRIWQTECEAKGEDYIICSIDKDLLCIPGKHYQIHKKNHLVMTPEASLRFFYEQLLKGDPTDNIKGIPKVGDVRATKYLAPFSTEAEFQYVVSEAYQGAFGNSWKTELDLNGKLLYLKKTHDDMFSLDGWNFCPYEDYIETVMPATEELVEIPKIVEIVASIPDDATVVPIPKFGPWSTP